MQQESLRNIIWFRLFAKLSSQIFEISLTVKSYKWKLFKEIVNFSVVEKVFFMKILDNIENFTTMLTTMKNNFEKHNFTLFLW